MSTTQQASTTFGQWLRDRRRELGNPSTRKIGPKVGVSHVTIGNWENDKYVPEADKLEPIAEVYEIDYESLKDRWVQASIDHLSGRSSWLLHTWSDLPRRIALTVPNIRRVSVPTVAA